MCFVQDDGAESTRLSFSCRATRSFMTLPPSLASINPRSAFSTALLSVPSSRPAFLAKRVKDLLLNIRTVPPQRRDTPKKQKYNTRCYRSQGEDFEVANSRT